MVNIGKRLLSLVVAAELFVFPALIDDEDIELPLMPSHVLMMQASAEETQDVELPEVAEEEKSEEEQVKDGLAGLFARYGVEIAEYNPVVLDVDAWEKGFIEAHDYYVRYMPSIDEKECTDFAAAYFIANYSHTDPSIIPTLAERKYVSANNNVDLVTVQASDGFGGTVTQPADIEGFTNFQNFNSYNRTRCDAIQRPIHEDWLALQENGGGNLDPDDYADPSVLIQDEYERSILHQWYVAYVEGYDLTKGSFMSNENMQKVWNAIGSLNGDKAEVSIDHLSPAVRSYARFTIFEDYVSFLEDFMYENYREELVSDPLYGQFFDHTLLVKNQFECVLDYETAQALLPECNTELDILIKQWLYGKYSMDKVAVQSLFGEVFGQKVDGVPISTDFNQAPDMTAPQAGNSKSLH